MNVSKDLLEKAKTAKTAEELLALAKAENIELTEEEAAKAFERLNACAELSDEELDNVSGGCGSEPEKPTVNKFNVGDRVLIDNMVSGTVTGFKTYEYRYKTHYLYDVKYTVPHSSGAGGGTFEEERLSRY
ncbi:MAG: Nif11-like leader peptide family RiPP precursor [Candidatus Coproplasma sp.]